VYHDLAGWLMMPLALAILWLELQFLTRLFIEPEPAIPLPVNLPPSPVERRAVRAATPHEAAPMGETVPAVSDRTGE
jgi:hypothetical protein